MYGGRLSAKAMHDIMVESLFPYKKVKDNGNEITEEAREAMKKAAERIRNYKNKPRSRSISIILKSSKKSSVLGEVRDVIYIA